MTRTRTVRGLSVALGLLAVSAAPIARAGGPAVVADCATPNAGDRSISVLTPDSTLNQVSVWLTADAGPDGAGVHVEPWARRAYFVDAGAESNGTATATGRVDGDDGEGASYLAAHVTDDGSACAASPAAGAGVDTAGPALVQAIVAGPQASTIGYATRVVVITRGAGVTFANADTALHDVVSTARDAEGNPRFRSAPIGTAVTAPVVGVDALAAGTYGFYCSLHPNMLGNLVVQDAG